MPIISDTEHAGNQALLGTMLEIVADKKEDPVFRQAVKNDLLAIKTDIEKILVTYA